MSVAINVKRTKVFANTAARVSAKPDFAGQIGIQLDNLSIWQATSLTVGAWSGNFGVSSVFTVPTDGTGYVGLVAQSSPVSEPSSGVRLFGTGTGFGFIDIDAHRAVFDMAAQLTSDRTYEFPDVNGTLLTTGNLSAITGTGNTLWVDSANGDDGTAVAGSPFLPYLTITAAKAAAVAGDTIIVRPGTYDERNLLKDEVYYYFELGAIVEYTGTANGAIFDDGATGANGAVHTKISGDGTFIYAGTSAAAIVPHVFNVTNSGTHIDASGQEIFLNISTTPASAPAGINQTAGYIKWLGHAIEANVGALGVNASCVRWDGGDFDITTERILATGNAYLFWSVNTAANSTGWVHTNRMTSGAFPLVFLESMGSATARLNIDVQTAVSTSAGSTGTTLHLDGGELYFRADRLVVPNQGAPGIFVSGGVLYVSAFQIEDAGTNNAFQTFTLSGGTTTVIGTNIRRAGSGRIFSMTAGSPVLEVISCNLTSLASSGLSTRPVNVVAGTASFTSCAISMTSRAVAPVSFTGGSLSLKNCAIFAEATTDCITGAGNVAIHGACWANRPVNAAITLTPLGSFTVDNTTTVSSLTISGTLTNNGTWADGIRQTFNPNATNAGINVGSVAGDPSSPSNGDLWYDSSANELTARINGTNVALGAGGGGAVANNIAAGRLTLTSGTPVLTTTVTGAGTVYFTPYNGNAIALYNGSSWEVKTFTELSITLSDLTASTAYDVWAYNNAGTVALDTTAWTNVTTRATALALQDGVYVKSGDATRRYVGSIVLDASEQCSVNFGASADGGTAGRCDIWNFNNRVDIAFCVRDTTNSWAWTTLGWQQANASAGNQVTLFLGLSIAVRGSYTTASGGTANVRLAGIGLDSTSALANFATSFPMPPGGTAAASSGHTAMFDGLIDVGQHYLAAIEYGNGSVSFYGDNNTTQLRSGLIVRSQY